MVMKITFIFNGETSQIHLHPENARDERYTELCIDGKPSVVLKTGKDKDIILEFISL